MTLQEILSRANNEKWALPHFNISNLVQLKGVLNAASDMQSPVMIGTSEGEANFIGFSVAVALIDGYRKETGLPIYLNADHFHSFETCKKAIDAGYDSVLIDMSKKERNENINVTKEVVKYARINGNVHVESELGYIVTDSSKIYKEKIEIPKESLTKPEEAKLFVEETGIDRFAAAVGNLHGIAANEPVLDFQRIKELREILNIEVAMVLHGGSGISDDDFTRAIKLGMNNIHISTNIRIAYVRTLKKVLLENSEEMTPYKLYPDVVKAVSDEVKQKILLFGSQNKR